MVQRPLALFSSSGHPGRRAEKVDLVGLRIIWLLLPVTLGPAVADAFHGLEAGTRSTVSTLLWALWAATLTATLVPLPSTLTVIRLSGPATAGLALWSVAKTQDALHAGLGLLAGTTVVLATLAAPLADRFVDGASYGDERRFLLRAPGPVALILGPITTVAAIAGIITGPLLLLDAQWFSGAVVTAAGWPMAVLAVRSLHQLALRWIVLVPAGFVLHDHLSLAEPTLLQRSGLAQLGAAPADTKADDFTQRARGLALEVRCRKSHKVLSVGSRLGAEVQSIDAFLCAPARPHVVLAEAARRRLPVN